MFWVGLPSIRGSRATSEMVYLNDLYRGRAEKAGITYIDIWDGFVDESNTYNNYGPDLEGQTRRLRSGDGAHFTRAGARKLAHYAEREIRRMMASVTPVATPLPQEPEPDTKTPPTAAAPGLPPRPAASPIMSLTAPKGAGDALLGATPVRDTDGGFGRHARAGERRAAGGAGRARRRLHLAAPRYRHRDRRAAARSGRAARACRGRRWRHIDACCCCCCCAEAGRAASAPRSTAATAADRRLGLVRPAAALRNTAAAAAARLLRRLVRRQTLVGFLFEHDLVRKPLHVSGSCFSSPAAHPR